MKYPVYGSLEEIERDFGVRLEDLHRPFIDTLTRPNPDDPTGKSTMRRIEDVFDCWFESGSMPFAQLHYPFENKELFQNNFPADFIVEYVAQTRGWFYTMMILSTALFGKPPFKNAICHGVINDEDGEKLSKSKRNYPDPIEVFGSHGSDTLKWYLMSSPLIKGGDLSIDKDGKGISEAARKMVIPLWNAYSFFCLYANTDKIKAEFKIDSTNLLDRYILSKTAELIQLVTTSLDQYDIPRACSQFEAYIEILNNWYIRRSRERFWRTEIDKDKVEGYNTLYTALTMVSRLAAPFLPFVTESIYKGLTGELSVHLANYPTDDDIPLNKQLVDDMDRVIEICSNTLSLRKKYNLRVRQPLSTLTVFLPVVDTIKEHLNTIANEVNVKRVEFTNNLDGIGTKDVVLNFKTLGSLIGKDFKNVVSATKSGKWEINGNGELLVAGYTISTENFEMKLLPNEGLTGKSLDKINGMVILDTNVTPALWEEGIVRDFVRFVQNGRKDAGLFITDKINIKVSTAPDLVALLLRNANYIKKQTLAESITEQSENFNAAFLKTEEIDETPITIAISKA